MLRFSDKLGILKKRVCMLRMLYDFGKVAKRRESDNMRQKNDAESGNMMQSKDWGKMEVERGGEVEGEREGGRGEIEAEIEGEGEGEKISL